MLLQVGSTTWSEHFLSLWPNVTKEKREYLLTNVKETHEYVKQLNSLGRFQAHYNITALNHESMKALGQTLKEKGFFTFTFVRHPFER